MLDCNSLSWALTVPEDPVQLISGPGKSTLGDGFLTSSSVVWNPIDVFTVLRVSAGDELAQLMFPRPRR